MASVFWLRSGDIFFFRGAWGLIRLAGWHLHGFIVSGYVHQVSNPRSEPGDRRQHRLLVELAAISLYLGMYLETMRISASG